MISVLETPLPPDVRAQAEEEMVASHCGHLDAERAAGMVEAQRLRDASFAAAVLRAREAGQGPVVLIAGSGHARSDVGVPAFLASVEPGLKVVSVGQTENDTLEPGVVTGRPFDFIRVTPPFEREDPCANFKPRARAGS